MSVSDNNTIFHAQYKTDRTIRKSIINTIIDKLEEHAVTTNLNYNELYLIIDEALTNAMEHGNKWDAKKSVTITIINTHKQAIIRIADQGDGFNVQEKGRNISDIKNLKPRGRGIFIIKQFCEVDWNDSGSAIDLIIQILKA